jgi:class 3 adenylate cyclase
MSEVPLTFLFTDVEGSTKLWEQHPEAMRTALARHDVLLRQAVQAGHGTVFKTVGDAFCAVFTSAAEAVAASLAAQRALAAEVWGETPLRVRMALHTGIAIEQNGDYLGPTINRLSRLLSAGHGGQILLSQATAEQVRDSRPGLRDLGEHRLKDLNSPEHIFQLLASDLPTDFPPLRSLQAFSHNLPIQLTSFIGRENEISEVKRLLVGKDGDDSPRQLLTLSGVGGTGKTRLALHVAVDPCSTPWPTIYAPGMPCCCWITVST